MKERPCFHAGLFCQIAGTVSLPFGAVLTDRCERKWVYAIIVMINCQGPLIYAWNCSPDHINYTSILLSQCFAGLMGGFCNPSEGALAMDILPQDKQGRILHATRDIQVRKRSLSQRFRRGGNDHFAKTGLGQTYTKATLLLRHIDQELRRILAELDPATLARDKHLALAVWQQGGCLSRNVPRRCAVSVYWGGSDTHDGPS